MISWEKGVIRKGFLDKVASELGPEGRKELQQVKRRRIYIPKIEVGETGGMACEKVQSGKRARFNQG